MRQSAARIGMMMFLLFTFMFGLTLSAAAEGAQGTAGDSLISTGNISITIVDASGATQSENVVQTENTVQ